VLPERFLRARYYVGIGVDLLGRADHPVDLPERAEGGRVPGRGRPQLGVGDPAESPGRPGRWRAEDGVPHHRQPRGVDHGLVVIERNRVRVDEAVQGDRLRGGICGVLGDGID
jgi:hypothetical protein